MHDGIRAALTPFYNDRTGNYDSGDRHARLRGLRRRVRGC
jgi:hypothetical protein